MPDREPYARMRLWSSQVRLLYRLLWLERGRMTRERTKWRRDFPATTFNQIIHHIDVTKKQLELIADEEDWDLGEPWVFDEEAASSLLSPEPPEPVGRWTGSGERSSGRVGGPTPSS